jgi:hypothetical protein
MIDQHKRRFIEFLASQRHFDNFYADEWLLEQETDFFVINHTIKSTGSISSFGFDSLMSESGNYLYSQ